VPKIRTAAVLLAALAAAARGFGQEPVQERVHVTVVEVTLHATSGSGEPVLGMTPRDLRLFVDGHDVAIESLDWVASEPAAKGSAAAAPVESPAPVEGELAAPPAQAGRRIVLFFQWHIEGAKIEGHLRMTRQALEFLDTLKPEDRAAVATFGSRLWLRQDFTNDRALLRTAVKNALALENAPASADPPSLSAIVRDGASATSIEKAFIALGDALRPIPGSKAIVFFGWGIGKYDFLTPGADLSLGRMTYSPDYDRAVSVLGRAQTPVFALDVSGGHHHLEAGLERLSFETGGYYLPTYDFPRWAMKTVSNALTGHYVLVFRPPALDRHGFHEIKIDGPSGVKLLYRQGYED
jgi:VWFA-related protein